MMPATGNTSRENMQADSSLPWAIVRFVIATIILTAAFLKAHQLATVPSLGEGIFNTRWFNILVVEFELLFGIWLLFGALPKLTWLASTGCFAVFASVSLYKKFLGEASCGCWGAVEVDPKYTFAFDILVLALLLWIRPTGLSLHWRNMLAEVLQLSQNRRSVLIILGLWILVAVPTTYAMLSVVETDGSDLGVVFTGLDGKETFLIDPNKWIGKELPLLSHLEATEALDRIKRGEWLVLLYHNDCEKCGEAIRYLSENQGINVICVEVPPVSAVRKCPDPFEHARMKANRRWMANTPIVMRIEDLVVKEIVNTFNENK